MRNKKKLIRYFLVALLAIGGLVLLRLTFQLYCDQSLLEAIKRGDRTSVQRFLAAGANPNVRGSMHTFIPIHERIWQMIQRRPTPTGSGNRYYGPALSAYVSEYEETDVFDIPKEDPEITAMLLRYGANIEAQDDQGMTALGWAVSFRHNRTVKLLLEHGANPNVVAYGFPDVILFQDTKGERVLLMPGSLVPHNHEPALIVAFRYHDMDSDTEAARLLIAHGASANTVASDGWTALMAAVWSGDAKAVQALVDRGADVNAKIGGHTLLRIINERAFALANPPRRISGASIQPIVKAGAKE